MKILFTIILHVLGLSEDKRTGYKWGDLSIYSLTRIIRQYTVIFNTLHIDRRRDRILIVAPNSTAWILLVIASMAKRLPIYIVSSRESLLNIRNIILTHEITHVFTNNDIGTRLKKSGLTSLIHVRSIIDIGIIYKGSLLDTTALFYAHYYSMYNDNDVRIQQKIEMIPQVQEMDDDELIDWARIFLKETDLYEINVFSEGTTRVLPQHHRFSGVKFERIMNKVRGAFCSSSSSVNLVIDYSEWVPFALSSFIDSAKFTKNNAEMVVFDGNTFLAMWKEVVQSKLQSPILNWLVNWFPFIMRIVAKKALKEHLGNYQELIILNGGMLPIYIKQILVKINLPIYTTFGTLGNGYISFMNCGKGILSDLQVPVYEPDGYVTIETGMNGFKNVYETTHYTKVKNPYKVFIIKSSTDSTHAPKDITEYHVLYEKIKMGIKFWRFNQRITVTKRYEGRYLDTTKVYDTWKGWYNTPLTIIKSLYRSVRLFNGVIIGNVGEDTHSRNTELRIVIEINQREKELLGLEGIKFNNYVNRIVGRLNKYLPPALKIHSFACVEEGTFSKTRNGNIKDYFYKSGISIKDDTELY